MRVRRFLLVLLPLAAAFAQTDDDATEHHRIFGIIPNYRSSPSLANYAPLTSKQKFRIASQDGFDQGTIALAAAFGGFGLLNNSNPSFGHGVAGYSQYWAASYGDYLIGDFMTEGIYPSLMHQDPRYFRRGHGSGWSRLGYSVGQIVLTHGDNGHVQFNFSEIAGNATAVAISNAYYVDGRSVSNNVTNLGTQLAVDAVSNILKEFFPDISRALHRKHHHDSDGVIAH